MSKWLECGECGEIFEVSDAIADAMRRWCEESGESFVCRECASKIEHFTDREPSTREHRKDFQNTFAEVRETEYYAKQNE